MQYSPSSRVIWPHVVLNSLHFQQFSQTKSKNTVVNQTTDTENFDKHEYYVLNYSPYVHSLCTVCAHYWQKQKNWGNTPRETYFPKQFKPYCPIPQIILKAWSHGYL